MAKVLILCPTFDHADTLFASIASVRAQTFKEWEMAVICDGSPPRTEQVLAAVTAVEPRIRVYRHPKSERYGEIYRDPVIRDSTAEFVAHLSDDDVWMRDHLAQMTALLENAEWANQAPLRISVSGGAEWWPVNHGTSDMRSAIVRRVPLSVGINYVAYRRDAYLRLPEGWTCAPWEAGTSDVYMWSKFFRNPELSVASSAVTSALKFPSRGGGRLEWAPENRLAEITPWLARAAEPGLGDRLRRKASVFSRMVGLFAVHGAGGSLAQAFERAGLMPAPPETVPRPALDGEPMAVPLTEAQRQEAEQAWGFVRAYGAEPFDGSEAAKFVPSGRPSKWIGASRSLASILGADVGVRALDDLRTTWPNEPDVIGAVAEALILANRREEADRFLNELSLRWPGHRALAAFNRAARTPEP